MYPADGTHRPHGGAGTPIASGRCRLGAVCRRCCRDAPLLAAPLRSQERIYPPFLTPRPRCLIGDLGVVVEAESSQGSESPSVSTTEPPRFLRRTPMAGTSCLSWYSASSSTGGTFPIRLRAPPSPVPPGTRYNGKLSDPKRPLDLSYLLRHPSPRHLTRIRVSNLDDSCPRESTLLCPHLCVGGYRRGLCRWGGFEKGITITSPDVRGGNATKS